MECDYCGREFDEPSRDCDNKTQHAAWGPEEHVLEEIESELHGRSGVGWEGVDEEIAREIRDALRAILKKAMSVK